MQKFTRGQVPKHAYVNSKQKVGGQSRPEYQIGICLKDIKASALGPRRPIQYEGRANICWCDLDLQTLICSSALGLHQVTAGLKATSKAR